MSQTPPSRPMDNRGLRMFLRVVGTIWGLLILPSIPVAMMSPMIVAAPGSEESPLTLIFLYATLAMPVILLATSVASWKLARAPRLGDFRRLAILVGLAPILIYGAIILLIGGFCDSKFVCKP